MNNDKTEHKIQDTFISYAQNFEDVLLNRVFRDRLDGFYIDIGALHPTSDSVTKAFYDRGWSGINIEPIKDFHNTICQERPRDINLNIAISDRAGSLDFFQVLQQPANSTLDKEIAYKVAYEKGLDVTSYNVVVKTLADICEEYINKQIDFLKIDVEGVEEQVILSGNWGKFRPTILLIESTLPNTNIRCQTNIPAILQDRNYQHVFFDGINDYFIAKESIELAKHFACPVNVLDFYVDYRKVEQQKHINNLLAMVSELQKKDILTASISSNSQLSESHQSSKIRPLKIAFDISVLGMGYLDKKARTGVYRVTDNILKGLLKSSDVTLYLCSSIASISSACQEYLKTEFKSIELPLFTISDINLLKVSLYHSPFYPIPIEVTNCCKLITIYDLIPVKFPEFFGHRQDSLIKGCLNSITDNDFINCISESTKKDLLNYDSNISSDRVLVSHLAADEKKFYSCQDLQLINDVHQKYNIPETPYLLSVCTLEPRKNLAHVIRCFLKLIQEKDIPDLNLVLVGTQGWQYDEIITESNRDFILRERIIFTGFVPDEDLAPLYSDALAFLYLSIYEGFGLPPLEAMQCGTPVITSNTSSLPEVVEEAGIMISPDDVDGLCDAIYNLYTRVDLRKLLFQKSLEQSEKFTWEKTLQQTIEIYKLALANEVSVSTPQIIVDGVFFQLYQTGISRVWKSLLQEWANNKFGKHIVVLDRAGTSPKIPGIRYYEVPAYDYNNTDRDRQILQQACNDLDAELFISTYYTTPLETPSVFMGYDMIPEILGYNLSEPMWQEKYKGIEHASAYITISNHTANDLVKVYPNIDPQTVTTAHCGVQAIFTPANDAEIAAFRHKYGISKPYFIVGASGGYKNVGLFLQAFALLPTKAGFDLIVTGGHGLSDRDRQYTVGSTVHCLRLDDRELSIAYSGAIALVYPSKYEGFGLPIVEAFASACPVITCRNASIPEVAGDAAIYVSDSDVMEMAAALCEVQKPQVRQALITQGIERLSLFSWTKMANIIQSVLVEQTLSHLQLDRTNLIIFPDWSADEELLGEELGAILSQLSQHPDASQMTLIFDTSSLEEIDLANDLVAAVVMNLMMTEDVDVTESLAISLTGRLAPMQWSALLPKLHGKIKMQLENLEVIDLAHPQLMSEFRSIELVDLVSI